MWASGGKSIDKSLPEVNWDNQMCLPEKEVGSHSSFSQGAGQLVF